MSFDLTRIFGNPVPRRDAITPIEYVMIQRPLSRVLAFTRRTIDDVVNCPLAKREVLGYYKLHRQVERQCDITDLERQWNPLG